MCTEAIYNSHTLLLLTGEETGAVCTCVQMLSMCNTNSHIWLCRGHQQLSSHILLLPTGQQAEPACKGHTVMVKFCYCQQVNRLEQLCSNLCAEAMQHYYNSHIFRGPNSALSDEGLSQQVDVQFFNNTPVIQLISAQVSWQLSLAAVGKASRPVLFTGLTGRQQGQL